jgi:hypothetical protein
MAEDEKRDTVPGRSCCNRAMSLARLRPDMYFKMPKCQNVGDTEVGDPKLANRKDTKIGEIVDYRRWGSVVGTPPLSYSSVAHFLPSD